MITVALQGGLGNQLFQIAAASLISKTQDRELWLPDTPKTHHSAARYYETILRLWSDRVRDIGPCAEQHEKTYSFQNWCLPPEPVRLYGYFQNYRYVPADFQSTLVLPSVPSLDGAFLHIRGGDYVRHPFHDVGLSTYYERAVSHFPPGTHFHVFTNDVSYAKSLPILQKVSHSFVTDSDEVVCLAKMKACTVGGICANSTFSWWGAYLNRGTRMLILPSKWFNDPRIYVEGYFFPGSFICQV